MEAHKDKAPNRLNCNDFPFH